MRSAGWSSGRSGVTSGSVATAAAAMLAAAGFCHAQDSVSTLPGLPGDAVSAYQTGASSEQINNYTVNLAPKSGSWGTRFRLGPVAKASRSNNGQYFDLLIGAQGVSARFEDRTVLRSSYAAWSAAGQGVNASANTAPAAVLNTSGFVGKQFSLAFMEFGNGVDGLFGTGDDENNLVSAVVSVQRRTPGRLLVSRVVTLTNKPGATQNGTASLGIGGVDAGGFVHAYADSLGMVDPLRVAQRHYLRVNAATRNGAINNQVFDGGFNDAASSVFIRNTSTSMTTPTAISSSLGAGGRPVAIGLDFNGDYIFESAAQSTQTTKNYLPGATGSPRGNLTFIPQVFAPVSTGGQDAGVAACLVRTDNNTRTRGINIFGVNTDGSVDGNLQITLPIIGGLIVDPTDNWNPATNFGVVAAHEFTSFASQVSFRGGNGQVATVVLPGGELLAAAVVGVGSGSAVPQAFDNYLAVARVTTGGAATWGVIAHTGNSLGASGGLSKVILGDNGADGQPGTLDAGEGDGVVDTGPNAWIGRLARLNEVFPSQTAGPSISAPAFDRRGNVYFMATVALKRGDGSLDYTSALLRGVRDGNQGAAGGYQLELLARLGDVIAGPNSQRNYQLQFLGIADNDSVSSGGLWSGNIVQDSLVGNAATAPYGSPASLGALVFRSKIVYDFDGDAIFADPSTAASNSPDQAYNVVMVLMPELPVADFNGDGAVSVQDIFDFLAAYFAGGGGGGDWNGDGVVSVQDIFDYLADYFAS